ncbi:MAG: ATP phosphoribosyltransferase regulatory subunit [Clostridia bacterium]|nr:ATP phosphoribosyltransferase regulatory subunit [Clostridia bacterium]
MMSPVNTSLKRDEDLIPILRRLYESYGYKRFKMSKFEEYDLYLENKAFLRNANIITVTDPAGRLLALKPDITLSIVKNVREEALPQKVYYSENIYLADSEAGEIKEAKQIGLEYIGKLDTRALGEILLLAAESLENIDSDYKIALSHMGFVSVIIDNCGIPQKVKSKAIALISEKNSHGLRALASECSLAESDTERLCCLISVCGSLCKAIADTKELVCDSVSEEFYNELVELSDIVSGFGLEDKFILDFSVLNDVNYYNGLVFQGFLSGVPKSVLSGGRYDNLVQRFGCDTSAAGFAVYIDLLRQYTRLDDEYDCDILMLYSADCNAFDVLLKQKEFANEGKCCMAFLEEPKAIKYRTKAVFSADGSLKYE